MEGRLLVAIPALNEQETVGGVVRQVHSAQPGADVLVIDDGSTDETAAEARAAGAKVLQLPFNVGVGGAMRAAFVYARDKEYAAVVQVDADGQHDPASISAVVAGLADSSIAIGARFAGEGEYEVRGPRRWAMRFLSSVISRIAKERLTDTTSGFRASDSRAIALFARHYPAEYLGDTVESLVIAARSGLVIKQVPVEMKPRQGGRASQNPFRASLYLARATLALAVALSRRRGSEAV